MCGQILWKSLKRSVDFVCSGVAQILDAEPSIFFILRHHHQCQIPFNFPSHITQFSDHTCQAMCMFTFSRFPGLLPWITLWLGRAQRQFNVIIAD